MACKGCGEKVGPRVDEHVFTFPFGPQAGIEVRTWGSFTHAQVALVSRWVELTLASILVDTEREVPPIG